MLLLMTGIVLVIAGSLIKGAKVEQKLRMRSGGNPVLEKISGNLGVIFFIIGMICILAGVAGLYL
jgi:hypothetical protein